VAVAGRTQPVQLSSTDRYERTQPADQGDHSRREVAAAVGWKAGRSTDRRNAGVENPKAPEAAAR
jgi:hypothetical protein